MSHYSATQSQGTIVMWAEINQQGDEVTDWDISKKPEEEFELRVVIWETEGLPMKDIEGTTDGFISCSLNNEINKKTDIHFRNTDGKCSWNYRMTFPVSYDSGSDENECKLKVSAWDFDAFDPNDLIGDIELNLKPMLSHADMTKR